MLIQSLVYLVLSVLVVIFAKYAHLIIIYIGTAYAWLDLKLAPIFSNSTAGMTIRNVLLLVIIPLLLAGIPALVYWLVKKTRMPYFFEIAWFIWLVLVLSKVLVH